MAFKGCTGLTEIFLPKTLTKVETDWRYTSPFAACDHLKKVVFEAGTTAVQNCICKDLTSLEEVVIPDSVTVIGANAFTNCVSLTQSDLIPDSVTEIGGGSFEGCTGLNSIQLPSKLEKLGSLAFWGCTGLTEIFLPKTLTTFEIDWHYTSPFVACDHLKKVVFEAGTTAVQNYSCKDLISLEEVVIPDSVTVIGGSAFANCSSLAQRDLIPDSVTVIGNGAFTNCVSLTQSDLIPDSVTEIGRSAFEGCTGLNSIQLPSNLEKIGSLAFKGCTGLTEILLPKTLTTVDAASWQQTSPFSECVNLKKVVFEAGMTTVPALICKDLTSLEEVVFPDGVTVIGNYAFTNCVLLTQSDLIPDSVTEIGWSAFEGCTGLNGIQLPSGLEKLGPLAFKGCTGLRKVTLPKTLTTVDTAWYDTSPFVECNRLKRVDFEAGTTAIPACICKDLTSLENAVIPEGVTSIGQHAFKNSSVLDYSYYKLPDSIERIESEAFSEAEYLLYLPDNVRYAASDAFGCNVEVHNGSRTAVTLINSGIRFSFSPQQRPEMPVLNLQESHMNLTSFVASTTRIHCTYSVKSDEFDRLSDMYIQFYIPEFAELAPNSLYLNKEKITDYRIDNERLLTVPVTEKTGKITFQIDALDLSEEEANDKNLKIFAILGYTKDGKNDYDVIDTVVDSYNTLTLTAPEEFSESFVTVSGFAPKGRIVTICIDEMDRVQLQANQEGRYSGSVSLRDYEMEDGKSVTLQAVIREANGKTLNAYTSTTFRERAPKLTEFTMLYSGKTYDLLAGTKYNVTFLLETFYGAQPFEFHVKYTEADVIESVNVTSTRNGVMESMKAVYDPKKDMFVAKGYFIEQNHDYVPGAIGVEFKRPESPDPSINQISEEMDRISRLAFIEDADGDGNVNINDVTAIQRHAAELELLTGSSLFAADTDRNGVVDINDATLLQQYLAEFNVTLGAQSETA